MQLYVYIVKYEAGNDDQVNIIEEDIQKILRKYISFFSHIHTGENLWGRRYYAAWPFRHTSLVWCGGLVNIYMYMCKC